MDASTIITWFLTPDSIIVHISISHKCVRDKNHTFSKTKFCINLHIAVLFHSLFVCWLNGLRICQQKWQKSTLNFCVTLREKKPNKASKLTFRWTIRIHREISIWVCLPCVFRLCSMKLIKFSILSIEKWRDGLILNAVSREKKSVPEWIMVLWWIRVTHIVWSWVCFHYKIQLQRNIYYFELSNCRMLRFINKIFGFPKWKKHVNQYRL